MLIGKPNMVPNIHSASNAQEEEISKEFVSNEV